MTTKAESRISKIAHSGRKTLLAAAILIFFGVVGVAFWIVGFTYLNEILSNDATLAPLALLFQILLSLLVIGLLGLAVAVIGKVAKLESLQFYYEGTFPSVENYRDSLMNIASEKKLNALDEYWEIVVFSISGFFVILAISNSSISGVADWLQISFSFLFWASYKIGKAKGDIGYRLMVIASFIQFLFVLGALYLHYFIITDFMLDWSHGGVFSQEFPYTSIIWTFELWEIVFGLAGIILLGKVCSHIVCRRIWKNLTEPANVNKWSEEALFASDYSVPSYLLYGIILLFGVIGPFVDINPRYFMNLILACILALCLLFFHWIAKTYMTRYDITKDKPKAFVSVMHAAGIILSFWGGYIFALVMGLVMLYITPIVVFSSAVGGITNNIIFANSVSSLFILLFVYSLSGSLVHSVQERMKPEPSSPIINHKHVDPDSGFH